MYIVIYRLQGLIDKGPMKSTDKIDYLIECYLDNCLPKKERIQFEKDLKTNPCLYKSYILNKRIDAAIYEYIQELEFRKKLDEIMNSGKGS